MVTQIRAMITILYRVRAQIRRRQARAEAAMHKANRILLDKEKSSNAATERIDQLLADLDDREHRAHAEVKKIDRLRADLNRRMDRVERLLNKTRAEAKLRAEAINDEAEDLAVNDAAWKKMGHTPPD